MDLLKDIQLDSISTAVGGLTSTKDVDKHVRLTTSKLIREINVATTTVAVLAEVKKVLTTVQDLELDVDDQPKYEELGSIYFQQVNGRGIPYETGEARGLRAKPLNTNIKELPVEGEYVMVQKLFGEFFYSSKINLFNNPNNASYQGFDKKFQLSDGNAKRNKTLETADTEIVKNKQDRKGRKLGESFEANFNFRQVVADEGDVVFNGRFGNSIKLGSNIRSEAKDSPNIKLRAGQLQDAGKFGQEGILEQLNNAPLTAPVAENINLDASSMWMTTDETVSLTPATLEDSNIYPTEVAPAEFSGKQIILNSGRLIFNSKESGILGFSNGPVDFSTLNTFGVSAKQGLNLYSPDINIGRGIGNDEPGKTKNIRFRSSNVITSAVDGRVVTYADNIGLYGELSTVGPSPAVRGNELKEVLEQILEMQKVTTQAVSDICSNILTPILTPLTPLLPGATAIPLQVSAETVAKAAENTLKDLTIKIELLPAILSKVVEVE
tara:strand:+ start:826 stop:2310 length:1485 start_codon:yes stop_codon:yes gene_type:complete